MHFLAEQLPADQFDLFGRLANITVYLIAAVLGLLKISDYFKKKDPLVPNPVVTEKKQEFVNRREFDALKVEVHETRGKVDEVKERLNQIHLDLVMKGQERSDALNARINDIFTAIKSNKRPQ